MNVDKFKKVIKERIRNCDELQDNWDYGLEQCRKQLIEILTENLSEGISFILKDCKDEDFSWISEVFEDIAEKTQSREFIEAVRRRLSLVTKENYNQESFESEHMRKYVDYDEFCRSINMEIEYAEKKLINS